MELNERIKFARQQAHVSQQKLATALGITRNAISLWEKGDTKPEIVRLGAIADLLGCNLEWLVYERGQPPEPRISGLRPEDHKRFQELKKMATPEELAELRARHTRDPLPYQPTRPLSVYAAEQGENGEVTINFAESVEATYGPAELSTVSLAYGLIVTDRLMYPALAPGDILWVHPHSPPQKDGFGVFFKRNPSDVQAQGGKKFVAIIRQLIDRESDGYVGRQFNPLIERVTIKWEQYHLASRIVGVSYRR